MNQEEHIRITDLINFAKRSGPDSLKAKDEKELYERIALHLGDCQACMEKLSEIRYVISDYDTVWENIFPLGAFGVIEQKSIPETKILSWISDAGIIKELASMFTDIEIKIKDSLRGLIGYYIPAFETTHGTRNIDSLAMYCLESSDISIIDSVELKDKTLVFHFSTETGYNKISVAGPNQIGGIADIINYNPGKYSATFPNINSKPEGLFVHLY